MNELGTVARDLVFLRRRVERHRVSPPATIFYLWACIVATGGILTDVAPGVGVVFWIVSGLAGGGASFWLGLRWSRRSGSIKPRTSVRHGLHWGGLLLATLLMGFVEGPRSTEPNTFGAGILLIVGLGYYYAGVHIHGVYFWVAGLQAIGYVVVVLLPSTPWSIVGLTIAAGLAGSGIAVRRTKPRDDRTSSTATELRLEA